MAHKEARHAMRMNAKQRAGGESKGGGTSHCSGRDGPAVHSDTDLLPAQGSGLSRSLSVPEFSLVGSVS
jgi:hypothetical protein